MRKIDFESGLDSSTSNQYKQSNQVYVGRWPRFSTHFLTIWSRPTFSSTFQAFHVQGSKHTSKLECDTHTNKMTNIRKAPQYSKHELVNALCQSMASISRSSIAYTNHLNNITRHSHTRELNLHCMEQVDESVSKRAYFDYT